MKYGRLENNVVVEVIDHDPTGKYVESIQWVQLPEEYVTTPEAYELAIQLAAAQAKQYDAMAEAYKARLGSTGLELVEEEVVDAPVSEQEPAADSGNGIPAEETPAAE